MSIVLRSVLTTLGILVFAWFFFAYLAKVVSSQEEYWLVVLIITACLAALGKIVAR